MYSNPKALVNAVGLALAMASISCSSGGSGGSSGGNGGNGGNGGSGGGGGSGGNSPTSGSSAVGGSSASGGSSGGGASSSGKATGGSEGVSITNIDGGKTIGSLTSPEADQLCKDTYAYFGKTINQATLCKWTGLAYTISSSPLDDTMMQGNCKDAEATCLKAGAYVPSCRPLPSTCKATVAQYSTCITEQAASYNTNVGALSTCSKVTSADKAAIWEFMINGMPKSCTSLTDECATLDVPIPQPGKDAGGAGGNSGTGGSGGGSGGSTSTASGGKGGAGGTAGNNGGTMSATGGSAGSSGSSGSIGASDLPGDVAKAAGTLFVAAHAMTRTLIASYSGPLFRALRDSDKKEQDIGTVATTGLVDLAALSTFCSGTTCKVTTLYDQSGNGNDMWRADDPTKNQPGTNKPCNLMNIEYWQMADGTKMPIAVEYAESMWRSTSQCLRNRDKTKNMPTGSKPQTTYAIFHKKYVNGGCCFNYGNTGNAIHYTGPGTLSALNFSQITFWSKGTGSGPWVMVDWEQGVYAGNIAKCGSGAAPTAECTSSGENPNPTVTFDVVTTLFKHDGTKHWALKAGNAKSGTLAVMIDLPTLPKGYSPLKQEGGLGLGEGGAGDSGGNGGFSEGAIIAGETSNTTDDAFQKNIVSVYGK
jgi:non-reducing end alpha-L-arabinofuranosidase